MVCNVSEKYFLVEQIKRIVFSHRVLSFRSPSNRIFVHSNVLLSVTPMPSFPDSDIVTLGSYYGMDLKLSMLLGC